MKPEYGIVVSRNEIKPEHGLKEPKGSDYAYNGQGFLLLAVDVKKYRAAESERVIIPEEELEIREGDRLTYNGPEFTQALHEFLDLHPKKYEPEYNLGV